MSEHEKELLRKACIVVGWEWDGDTCIQREGSSWGPMRPLEIDYHAMELAKLAGVYKVSISMEVCPSYLNECYYKPNTPITEVTMEDYNQKIRYAIVCAVAEKRV